MGVKTIQQVGWFLGVLATVAIAASFCGAKVVDTRPYDPTGPKLSVHGVCLGMPEQIAKARLLQSTAEDRRLAHEDILSLQPTLAIGRAGVVGGVGPCYCLDQGSRTLVQRYDSMDEVRAVLGQPTKVMGLVHEGDYMTWTYSKTGVNVDFVTPFTSSVAHVLAVSLGDSPPVRQ